MPKTSDEVWRGSYEKYDQEKDNGNIEFKKTDSGVLLNEKGESAKWNVYTKIWLKDRQEEGQIPSDIISKFENRHSSKELSSLNIPFDFAKPIDLIKYLIYILQQDKDIIILDFFSGSATTAHAVMQLNAEDGGNRKFIMVQLPEKTDEKSEAYKAGYHNICEIGKERIRRAGAKIVETQGFASKKEQEKGASLFDTVHETQNKVTDIGFRVYRLDTSNMQDVYYRPQDYKQEMMDELFANHIKPERTADDLVAQVMLDWGLPLSLPIEQTKIAGKTVYKVDGNALYCCFDDNIDETFARAVATFAPLRIVFHDHSFASDTAKENVRQLLKQLSSETEMKVV
ncbi:MAG: DNA methyltransferase [Paludibacter sp.]